MFVFYSLSFRITFWSFIWWFNISSTFCINEDSKGMDKLNKIKDCNSFCIDHYFISQNSIEIVKNNRFSFLFFLKWIHTTHSILFCFFEIFFFFLEISVNQSKIKNSDNMYQKGLYWKKYKGKRKKDLSRRKTPNKIVISSKKG